jgi:hypothetical protein
VNDALDRSGQCCAGAVRGAAIDHLATLAAVVIVSLTVVGLRLWLGARRSKASNGAEEVGEGERFSPFRSVDSASSSGYNPASVVPRNR